MPRYYPDDCCNLYIEHVVKERDPLDDWKRHPKSGSREYHCWGYGSNWTKNTGMTSEKFPHTRLKNVKNLPTAGQEPLFKIHRAFPGFLPAPMPTPKLEEDFKMRNAAKSKDSSKPDSKKKNKGKKGQKKKVKK